MQGHVVGQEQEPPLEVMMLSNTEAVIEFSSKTNIERIAVWMSPLQYWLGQRIQLVCTQAAPEEVGQARRHEEEAERESMPDTQETTLFVPLLDILAILSDPEEWAELGQLPIHNLLLKSNSKEPVSIVQVNVRS